MILVDMYIITSLIREIYVLKTIVTFSLRVIAPSTRVTAAKIANRDNLSPAIGDGFECLATVLDELHVIAGYALVITPLLAFLRAGIPILIHKHFWPNFNDIG